MLDQERWWQSWSQGPGSQPSVPLYNQDARPAWRYLPENPEMCFTVYAQTYLLWLQLIHLGHLPPRPHHPWAFWLSSEVKKKKSKISRPLAERRGPALLNIVTPVWARS